MFKFLKEKLKNSVSMFSKKIEESGEEVVEEVEKEVEKAPEPEKHEAPKKTGFFSKLFKKKDESRPSLVEKIDRILEPKEEEEREQVQEEAMPEPQGPAPEPVMMTLDEDQPQDVDIEVLKEQEIEQEPQQEAPQEKSPEPAEMQEFEESHEETVPEPPLEVEQPQEEPTRISKEMSAQELIDSPFEEALKEKPEFEKEPEEQVEAREEAAEIKQELDELNEEVSEIPPTPEIGESQPEKVDFPEFVKQEEEKEEPQEEKKGFFGMLKEKIISKKISEEKFNEMFWDLEVGLLENNVAMQVIEKIKEDMKRDIVEKPIRRNRIEETIVLTLKKSIDDVLSAPMIDILKESEKKKPYVICFVGINGSGKTTTIAKMTNMLIKNNKKVVLAAADTFRAAAIDQLQIHAEKLGVKMIKHDYGADPAAVAFDAVKYAEAKDIDVVLIDTAGRLHSNTNLVDEMKKITRVAKPDLKLFVGEAITGNDCIEQAEKFNEAIGIDGIVLAKADIDEKGGASLSVSYVTKKPVLFMGTGQEYDDLKPFDKNEIIASLGLGA